MYWKQGLRLILFSRGDRNSKFFHVTTVDSRKCNKIVRLKSGSDVWLEEESEVMKECANFLANNFISRNSIDGSDIMNCIPILVTT